MAYAQDTRVSVASSRAEIERTLARYGASAFSYGHDSDTRKALIMFRASGRIVRFELPLPAGTEQPTEGPGSGKDRQAWLDGEERRRWRALALAVKAKLEVVASGITTFEDEFLAHVVLPDNTTVGQWARPAIEQSYTSGKMPDVLPGGTRAAELPPGH